MKSSRIAGKSRRILSLVSVGIVTGAAISGIATAQNLNVSSPAPVKASTSADDKAIRPFTFSASKEALADLRRRIAATRWPEKETIADQSQGVQLATIQNLARYWATEYDWSKVRGEAEGAAAIRHNIDGLDIHFIHVRSKEKSALPVIITHGWPGSIIEQMKIIDPLTKPTAHGGKAKTLSMS